MHAIYINTGDDLRPIGIISHEQVAQFLQKVFNEAKDALRSPEGIAIKEIPDFAPDATPHTETAQSLQAFDLLHGLKLSVDQAFKIMAWHEQQRNTEALEIAKAEYVYWRDSDASKRIPGIKPEDAHALDMASGVAAGAMANVIAALSYGQSPEDFKKQIKERDK